MLVDRWAAQAEVLGASFATATPFPMVVIDGFLDPEVAEGIDAEFPDIEAMPKSRDYLFGNKHELSSVERAGPWSQRFAEEILSPEFASFLHRVSGFDVFVDPLFHGGGFHQGGKDSFLDFHVDFNVHPLHADWHRRLNILVYLNRGWREEWGGHLLVKSRPDQEPVAIAPLFNRAVIMLTDDRTYHGYRRLAFPPGRTRRSLAAYAYERIAVGDVAPRTTGWVPEQAGPAKRLLARNYNTLVRTKNRWLGSGTAKNR